MFPQKQKEVLFNAEDLMATILRTPWNICGALGRSLILHNVVFEFLMNRQRSAEITFLSMK